MPNIPVAMKEWLNLLGWLFSITTVLGNGFLVFLIAQRRRLHSSSNWLILSLAVADFLVGVSVFPTGYLCFASKTCNLRVYMAFYWFFLHSSATNLCVLTWDRYTAIVHPFKYITSMTARRTGIVIFLSWFIPLVISLYLILGMYATDSLTAWKILRLTGVSAFDILVCMLVLYGVARILFVARAKAKQESTVGSILKNLEESTDMDEQQNPASTEPLSTQTCKKQNAALFLIAIATFFLGCHAGINYLVLYIMFSSHVSDIAGQILTILLILNSAANPLVYAFLKTDIKSELEQLVSRRKHWRRFSRQCDSEV